MFQGCALAEPGDVEKTPYELFAQAYMAGDDIDVGAVFDSFGGLENIDWDAFVRAFPYKIAFNEICSFPASGTNFVSMVQEYFNNDFNVFMQAYYLPASQTVIQYKDDLLSAVPENIRAYCSDKVCLMVDAENLETFHDTLINVIQPQVISLLRERIPVIANALDNEMSSETGLYFDYLGADDAMAMVNPLWSEDGMKSRMVINVAAFTKGEKDNHELLDFQDKLDTLVFTMIHENTHLFMFDYNRGAMQPDVSAYEYHREIDYTNWTFTEYYTIPGSDDTMTVDEITP